MNDHNIGPRPYVVHYEWLKATPDRQRRRHASYQRRSDAEDFVVRLEEHPETWGNVRRAYPDEATP